MIAWIKNIPLWMALTVAIVIVSLGQDTLKHPTKPNISSAGEEHSITSPPAESRSTGSPAKLYQTTLASPSNLDFPTEGTFASVSEKTRDAIVNILCERTHDGIQETTSGSGIVVHVQGYILTSAHVAYALLLKDAETEDSVTCTLRTGNPADDHYDAELVFITPAWVRNHAPSLNDPFPRGTGEEDFAILRIVSTTDSTHDLPHTFSFVAPQINTDISINEAVLVAGYPIYGSDIAQSIQNLYLVSRLARISELFTFNNDTLDLFSIASDLTTQHGISGGAVVTRDLEVAGIVVTRGTETSTHQQTLNVVSLDYINRRVYEESGYTLAEFLQRPPRRTREEFIRTHLPSLTQIVSK